MATLDYSTYKFDIGDWKYYHHEGSHVYVKNINDGKQEAVLAEFDHNPIHSVEELDILLRNNSRFYRNKNETPRTPKTDSE